MASSRSSSVTSNRSSLRSNSHNGTPTGDDPVILISSNDESSSEKDSEWKPAMLPDASCVIKSEPHTVLSDSTAGPSTANTAPPGTSGEVNGAPRPQSRSHTPSPPPWYEEILTDDLEGKLELSGKLCFLVELLHEAERRKEKVLVFTQSLLTLDLIEEFLSKEEHGEWTPGLDYYRLDGSTKPELRSWQMEEFNELSNDRFGGRMFVIHAGSLGSLCSYSVGVVVTHLTLEEDCCAYMYMCVT